MIKEAPRVIVFTIENLFLFFKVVLASSLGKEVLKTEMRFFLNYFKIHIYFLIGSRECSAEPVGRQVPKMRVVFDLSSTTLEKHKSKY